MVLEKDAIYATDDKKIQVLGENVSLKPIFHIVFWKESNKTSKVSTR